MDAKVLRAAVSAAIRVTISTTLIGCGGSVVGEASGAGGAPSGSSTGGTPASAVSGDADEHVSTPQVPSLTGATGGGGRETSSATATAGTATSIDLGGMASASGGTTSGGTTSAGATSGGASQAGESSSAGAPAEECGAAVAACLTQVEPEVPSAALSDAGKACCDTIIAGFDELRLAKAACFNDLDRRFMTSGVRQRCCADPVTWTHLACTPWGPPVPPELPAAALQAWGLVA